MDQWYVPDISITRPLRNSAKYYPLVSQHMNHSPHCLGFKMLINGRRFLVHSVSLLYHRSQKLIVSSSRPTEKVNVDFACLPFQAELHDSGDALEGE